MRKFYVFFLILALSASLFAGSDATILDDVLYIPYASESPTIDGELDGVWLLSTSTPMLLFEGAPEDTIGIFDDHFAAYRAMWDDDYFYVFVEIVDQEINTSIPAEPWNNDCIEIFFDGGNEKATSYDNNDVQWRWVYGDVPGDTNNIGNGPGDWSFLETESGFNFELRISQEELEITDSTGTYQLFELVYDHEIGFEISNADNDGGVREDVFHWWTTDGNTWQDASLFGTALLSRKEVDEVLKIFQTDSEPDIDGIMDDGEGWEYADENSLTRMEGEVLPDTIYDNWKDHLASFWTLWDEDNFYVYVKVIDEEINTSLPAEPWNNDCVEIFFDGGNEKATSYDENDIQWRWVYGDVPGDTNNIGNGPGVYAWEETELGWDFELKIPSDDLVVTDSNGTTVLFDLLLDEELGFEISNADNDGGAREDVRHWWTTDGNTWQDASLFGTAIFFANPDTKIEDNKVDDVIPSEYNLSQNYPNPFNPTTKIDFSVPQRSAVSLRVYDIIGREVAVLVNEVAEAGNYSIDFDASQLSSGVYFYKLSAGPSVLVRKMMLLK